MKYIFNPLPKDNVENLAHGIEQALLQIQDALNTVDVNALPVLTAQPGYVFDGMLCCCDGINWNPLNDGIKRAVIYLNGNWQGVG